MNKRFRKFPTISLKHEVKNVMILCKIAYYNIEENKMLFRNFGRVSEEESINVFLHEMEHWVQFAFLSKKEIKSYENKHRQIIKDGKTPFTEWINPVNGNYDYSYYEDKYNHKYIDLLSDVHAEDS